MSNQVFAAILAIGAASLLASCADPHFMPRTRPLFIGLEETAVPDSARNSLNRAKADFQLARNGRAPLYARYVEVIPHSSSKVYEGDGYRLTLVREEFPHGYREGPAIVISSRITGGAAFHYDEVDECSG